MIRLLPLLLLTACGTDLTAEREQISQYARDMQAYCKKRPVVDLCENWIWKYGE